MRLLVTSAHPTLLRYPQDHLGRLVQPRHYSSVRTTAESGMPWAADNDCFQGLDADAFVRMLDVLQGLPGCLFVTVPDKVGDAMETATLFDQWAPALERRGLPVALVAQNGLEHMHSWLGYQWHRLDAVFLGGTDSFKLGPFCRLLVARAHEDGKWAHMGRVNGFRRLEHARRIGCDSVDGSSWSRWRDTWLPQALSGGIRPRHRSRVALASAVAFACAFIADWVVYDRLHLRPWLERSNWSNVAGAGVDSLVFLPLAFGGWPWQAIFALFTAKVAGGMVACLIVYRSRQEAIA